MGPFEGKAFHGLKMQSSDQKQILIVTVLARVLSRLIDINRRQAYGGSSTIGAEMFESSICPPIDIDAYLIRIQKYAKCSDACFIVALIYIDRLIELRNIVLTSLNIHRILLTAILISCKTLDDVSFNNSYFAKLGGINNREMNILEGNFLSLLNYSLFVLPESYDKYCQELKTFSEPLLPSPLAPYGARLGGEDKQNIERSSIEGKRLRPVVLCGQLSAPPPPSFVDTNTFNSCNMYASTHTQSYFSMNVPNPAAPYSVPTVHPPYVPVNIAPLSPSRVMSLASYYSNSDNNPHGSGDYPLIHSGHKHQSHHVASHATYAHSLPGNFPPQSGMNPSYFTDPVSKYFKSAMLECAVFR